MPKIDPICPMDGGTEWPKKEILTPTDVGPYVEDFVQNVVSSTIRGIVPSIIRKIKQDFPELSLKKVWAYTSKHWLYGTPSRYVMQESGCAPAAVTFTQASDMSLGLDFHFDTADGLKVVTADTGVVKLRAATISEYRMKEICSKIRREMGAYCASV